MVSEANHLKLGTETIQDSCKAPINLERFSRFGHVTAASITLQREMLALRRQEMLVCCNAAFDRASTFGEAHRLKIFQTYSGIADAAVQRTAENG